MKQFHLKFVTDPLKCENGIENFLIVIKNYDYNFRTSIEDLRIPI